jgi:uncharacterized protein (TIGR00162 family)
MKDIIIDYTERPELNNPILIEGLPGVGNVGKLAAEHMIDELKAKKFATIISKYFPPQVIVNEDGVVKLVTNDLYYLKREKKDNDLLILVGDYQGLSPEGQYELTYEILDISEKMGVKKIFTLGGYGLGKMVEEPKVLGAATNLELVKEMKDYGVVFQEGEPGSGIVGASGLLLGLGAQRGMEAVCLMGETSGYFVDPKSARGVLRVLCKALDEEVDFFALETKAAQIDKITSRFKEIEKDMTEAKADDLRYIG